MIEIAKSTSPIYLGRIGENEARQIKIHIGDILTNHPAATFTILHQRHGDDTAYPVPSNRYTVSGNFLLWTLTSGDLTKVGTSQFEVIATENEVIVKTLIYSGKIETALDGSAEIPEPWTGWVQQVTQSALDAETAADRSETNVTHYPQITNGFWMVWDASQDAFVSTDVPAQGDDGADGFSPTATVSKSGTTAIITITDKDGTTTATVSDGDPTELIDDESEGADNVWSAQKVAGELEKKAPIIISSASGSIASFPDGADDLPVRELTVGIEPMQDLHGYDSPWPGGGGVNKANLSGATAYNDGTYGLHITVDENAETITLAGTWSNSSTNGVWRFVSVPNITNGLSLKVFEQTSGNHVNSDDIRWDGTYQRLIITCRNMTQNTAYTIVIKLVAYEGETAPTSWTPYSNICPITGWNGVNVTRTGKNLLPNVTGTRTAGMAYYIGQSSGNTYPIHLFGGQAYTLTFTTDSTSAVWGYYKTNGGSNILAGMSGASFTPSADMDVQFWVYSNTTFTSVTDFQLEFGSTASAYESYQGETYDIAFPSDAGTVYGGELTVNEDGTRRLVVDRYFKSFTTLVGKSENADGYFWYTTSGALGIPIISGLNAKLISNRLVTEPNVSQTSFDGRLTFYANGIIRWKEQSSLTLQEYRTYLANNPLEICYELAEPITYTLTASQIRTLLGQNNIWADTGDTSVSYPADTKLYIDNKITQAIAAALNA